MLGKALLTAATGMMGGEVLGVEDVFSTFLYTGNSSTQTITNGIDLAGEGGMVWIKSRDQVFDHTVVDTIRGGTERIAPNLTATASTQSVITSFRSDGFTLGSGFEGPWNQSSPATNYVSWTFRKAPKFFDVVTWVGDGVAGRTISHSLGSAPGCIIVKNTSGGGNWQVWHRSVTANSGLFLNATDAATSASQFGDLNQSTSTSIYVDNDAQLNSNGQTYVAYIFAHDAGGFGDSGNESVISCGSFTTNGSGAATVNLGWEPQWILIKRTSAPLGFFADNWNIIDALRGFTANQGSAFLSANTNTTESSTTAYSINSTGFSQTIGGDPSTPYIYIAIRRGPMKTPESGAEVFNATATSAPTGTQITTGFPVDWQITKYDRSIVTTPWAFTRLTRVSTTPAELGEKYLATSNSNQEATATTLTRNWGNTGFEVPSLWGGSSSVYWNFRRAPGFFDVVAWSGNGVSNRAINHSLGVVPEFLIFKRRTNTDNWLATTNTWAPNAEGLWLNTTNAKLTGLSALIGTSAPTDTQFYVSSNNFINGIGDTYIAYLFATLPGISKVGSYTGTGTTLNIDCGFTSGARFVLIKRTDSAGDWYVWDTARGIIAANDPYLLLNSTAAEVTSTDYIDPLSSGFQISSTAPAAINANGGSFIFLAIA